MRKGLTTSIALLVAEFFYCGRIPFAPGTMGSLGSLVIWVPAVVYDWPIAVKLSLLVCLFFVGTWAAGYGIKRYQRSDPQQVVIDEVVGQGIPFLVIDPSLLQVILAVAMFRFFDIVKPWPIKALEQRFPNKWGIMIDDVAAGIFASLVIVAGKALFS